MLLLLSAPKQNCTVSVEFERNNYRICWTWHVELRCRRDTTHLRGGGGVERLPLPSSGARASHLVQSGGVLIAEPQPPVPNPFLREKLREGAGREIFFFFFSFLSKCLCLNKHKHTLLSVPAWALRECPGDRVTHCRLIYCTVTGGLPCQ